MPDISQVESALAGVIAGVVYPNGTGQPSITGTTIKVYRGWPNSRGLDADLKAGLVNVSIFTLGGQSANQTASIVGWKRVGPAPDSGMSLSVSGDTATLSGTAVAALNVALIADSVKAVAAVAAGTSAAAAAALVGANVLGAVVNGASIRVPGADRLDGRIGLSSVRVAKENRRQMQVIQVSCWCPTPDLRDAVGSAVDNALAAMKVFSVNGYAVRIRWRSSVAIDQAQNALEYRRDLTYEVIFPTTGELYAPQAIVGQVSVDVELDTGL